MENRAKIRKIRQNIKSYTQLRGEEIIFPHLKMKERDVAKNRSNSENGRAALIFKWNDCIVVLPEIGYNDCKADIIPAHAGFRIHC